MTVSSLSDYINAITAINKMYRRIIYRGQADKSWGIESSAYRVLKKNTEKPTQKMLQDYHLKLIREVKNLHDIDHATDKYTGIALLAYLQHNGAKTGLIDYTVNPLISLWFACISEDSEDGAVYCIENSGIINDLIPVDSDKEIEELFMQSNAVNVFDPPNINRRILSQQSVLLFSTSGTIDKRKHMTIVVPNDAKKEVLDQLSLVGICKKTVFPDFPGFLEWFSFESGPDQEKYDELFRKAEKKSLDFKYDEAIKLFEEALALGQTLFGENSVEIAAIYHNMASAYKNQGDYPQALEWHQKALVIREKALGKEHPDTASTYNNMAIVYYSQGDYPKALEWHQKALVIREKALGKEHPDTAKTYNNMAGVYYGQGDYPKALEWYQKALDIHEKALGKEHPDTASTYNNMANVYDDQGDYPKALEWHQKALDICEKALGKEHPNTASTYNNMASVYKNQGDYPKALEWYQKALDIREKALGKEHPDTAQTYNNMAGVYYSQGDYPKALEWYQKALDIYEKALGKEHPDTAMTYNNMASVYNNQGDYPKALEWYQKALDIREKALGKEHPKTIKTQKYIENTKNRLDDNIT